MKSIMRIWFSLVLVFISVNVVYAKEEVKFSKCVDGDTIKVIVSGKEKTVRFLAVDTPESVHPTKGVEYYGKEASNFTCEMVTNAKKIELEYDNDSEKEDKYDRLLAWVWVDDLLLQDELIKNGYAEVAYLYGDYKYTALLKDHQKLAEVSKKGIWDEEARKEFEPESSEKKDSTNDKETLNIEDMSTKEIIVLIIVTVLVSLLTPYVKKLKRKIKKVMR